MKRKGFTLIELLAVIVILAIIAVIATPIIIGIVENARKDAFQRSVELVVSATDININDKIYEDEYTYTLTDGVISGDVKVSNTEGMNGSITYDIEGNVKYSIHNNKWCVIKDDNGSISVTDYVDGECGLGGSSSDSGDDSGGGSSSVSGCYEIEDLDGGGVAITDYLCEETNIVIPATVGGKVVRGISSKTVYSEANGYYVTIGAFEASEITSVKFPNSIESIGDSAFRNNNLSGELDLSNTKLKSIGYSAFDGSSDGSTNQIESIKFPNSIESIRDYAFRNNNLSGELDLSNTQITSIGSHAFEGSSDGSTNQIESIKFPDSIESIRDYAFYANNLSGELNLSNTQLINIDGRVFAHNAITSVQLPNNLESIGNEAFAHNNLSGELDLSNLTNLTSIENSAFYGFRLGNSNQIESIKFPNNIEIIENFAFADNKLSGELDLSNTKLTSIGYDTFRNNEITSIKLPNNLESIGDEAFSSNYSNCLESVTFFGRSNLDGITLGEDVWSWAEGHDETNSIFFQ